ncbi:MAG: ribonuclease Z [Chitinophagia bacterium]
MLAVTILGNNSALPAFGRHPTAQVLTMKDQLMLIDCGEGTQMQLSRYKIRISKINYIFISHLHGDHYFGLIGFLTSMGLLNRKHELVIMCPHGLPEIIQLQLAAAGIALPYPIQYILLEQPGILVETRSFTIACFPVEHRISCWGCLVREKKMPRKIDREKVLLHQIPAAFYEQLQKGYDYNAANGAYISNDSVTIAASPAVSYAYSSDTRFLPELAAQIQSVTLLYHESTYLHDLKDRAYDRYHSTAQQAATIATLAGVKRLLIGHFSSKYEEVAPFEQEAKQVFTQTELAIEGVTYLIK